MRGILCHCVKEVNTHLAKLPLNFNGGLAKLNFHGKTEVSKPPSWMLNHRIALKFDRPHSSRAAKTAERSHNLYVISGGLAISLEITTRMNKVEYLGVISIQRCRRTSIGIPMLKIRVSRSSDL